MQSQQISLQTYKTLQEQSYSRTAVIKIKLHLSHTFTDAIEIEVFWDRIIILNWNSLILEKYLETLFLANL